MLVIRLKRLGRKGHPVYRMVVQDSRRHPSSGRVVSYLGSYNPHTKELNLDTEKAKFYLSNGAQPSDRAASLLKESKVDLPEWVKEATKQDRKIRNPDKLRKNQPKEEPVAEEPAAAEADTAEAEAPEEVAEAPAPEEAKEEVKEESKPEAKDDSKEEKPAEDKAEKA